MPFVEIGEPILIGVLIESVGVFDGQRIFFKPLVRHRRMHLRVLQRGGHAVGPDEMFFRNEKARAHAGFPLDRFLELLGGAIELDRHGRRRRSFGRNGWRSDQPVAELDGTPPNDKGRNEKE